MVAGPGWSGPGRGDQVAGGGEPEGVGGPAGDQGDGGGGGVVDGGALLDDLVALDGVVVGGAGRLVLDGVARLQLVDVDEIADVVGLEDGVAGGAGPDRVGTWPTATLSWASAVPSSTGAVRPMAGMTRRPCGPGACWPWWCRATARALGGRRPPWRRAFSSFWMRDRPDPVGVGGPQGGPDLPGHGRRHQEDPEAHEGAVAPPPTAGGVGARPSG